MCDCFHLAFPNWHAPAAGAGRRLRGPEQEAEDDSVCEDPEVLERERPRPQGSSPVEEFPVEKQAEEDMSDTVHKSGSNKKNRKGFGSLFEKRTSDKMNETEDVQSGESEVIVKTVKEACVEGLVVTGGGKEGIFIKEVKLDSPASRELRVKEGDQILSATVYFDNVSYEDALQILERAQPYKMEFCLRRKVEPSIPENTELIHPEEKDHGPPVMRSQRKIKKQQERISWPKFPSFGKGPRVQFNRSHSTSEAEEHRKLELSPPTSDNESPIKSPLKCPDGKDKKKKHKVELKMKMKGHRSKSVEGHQTNENVNVQAEGTLEEKFSEGHEGKIQDILQVLDGAEYEISIKTENDDPFQMERHEAHLISLGNTLKTTDISVALAEGGKRESSEMKVRVHEEGTPNIGAENQAESFKGLNTILAPPALDSDVLPQAVVEKFDNDLSTQGTGKDSSEKKVEFGHAEIGTPNLDICVGASKKSPRIDEKQRRSGFQNESYGIRTRGPLADIATAKTHFVRTENGLQFISPDFSELMQVGKTEDKLTDKEDIETSTLPTERFILADLDRTSTSKFKLPKIENSGFVPDEEIKITEVEKIRTHLPKRDDIEIPGMENKEIKPSLQTPEINLIKTEKIINITKERGIQCHQIDEEFNVEDVKVAVSKFPCFKLPEGDITGVLVQREITIMEQKSEKSTPRGSPRKISTTSTDSCTSIPKSKLGEEKSPSTDTVDKDTAFKVPKVELPSIDEQTSTAVMKIDYTQLQITDYERFGDINFKLPKREDIEIPGMEAIKESKLQDTVIKTVSGADLDKAERPRTKKHSDKKGHDKKSKKPSQPENQSPNISTELQKRDPSKINTEETRIHEKHTFKMPKIREVENIDAPVQEIKLLEDTMDKEDLPQKTETGQTKFKIPSITLPEFGTKVPRGAVDISAEDVQIKEAEIKLSDEPLLSDLEGTDVNKDGQSVNVYGRAHDTETGQGTKFRLPKFEISFPEVKAPRIICTSKKDDDSSLSERESDEVPVVHSSKAELPDVKLDVSTGQTEINSEITKVKIKRPGFSFPRFGIATSEHAAQEADVNLTNVDMSLPEGSIETPSPNAKIAISVTEGKQKDATKFKIPSIKFPHFGAKVTKAVVETSYMEPDVKGAQISLPDTEVKLPTEPITIKDTDGDKEKKSEFIYMDIQGETQRSKFKLPKFPEVKEPKIDISSDIHISKEKLKMNPPDIEVQDGINEVKVDLPFGTNIPKTAKEIPQVEVDVKGPEIVLPDAKIKLSAEPLSVDLKGPDADKEINSLSMDVKIQDIQIKEKGSELKSPTFGISIHEINGAKINMSSDKKEIDISVLKAQVDVHPPGVKLQGATAELKANLPEVCSKDFETKRETPGFSFPMVDSSKSDVKSPEGDVTLLNVDVSLREGSIEIERAIEFTLPKFGAKGSKASVEIPDVDVDVERPEISLPDAEIKLSGETLSVDVKGPDADKEMKTIMKMKDQDFQIKEQGSKLKFPKFGIGLPEIKGPKGDASSEKVKIDISVPTAEVHPTDVELQDGTVEVKSDLSEVDSKDFEVKMKTPGFSFPKIGFDKSEVKAPEGDVSVQNVDISLSERNIKIKKPTTDVTVSIEDAQLKGRSKLGSKFPSINFPKFGAKGPKTSVEIPDVDVEVKGPEISLPDTEIKLSAEPFSVDVKGPDTDKPAKSVSMEIKDQDIQMKKEGTKFNLPKFGISLPEIKGPKIDVTSGKAEIDISVPKGKVEVHPPDVEVRGVTAEVKADLPEVDSKDFEVKMKTPGFSFPKIGFDKSDVKAPEVDVSLPEGNLEIEKPTTDVTVSIEDAELKGRSKFGSPTKFKLPSLNFPKFGVKSPKASVEIPDVDVEVKGPEISLPDAEIKLSAEPFSVDVKGPDTDKQAKSVSMEIKDQDIQMKKEGTKFNLPKFGISLPEIKGPKIDVTSGKAEIDISVPKGKVEVHPPDVEVQSVTAEVKADLPEVDSKDFEVKMKTPGFSFPKIGFDKSDVKAPEVDVSLPKGNLEIEKPTTDVTVSIEDAELKGRSKFGSPTKFKLPSLNFPKFGVKSPKASVEIPDVDVEVKGPEISVPDAEIKLSAEPFSVDVKGPDTDKQTKSVSMEIKDQDIQMKKEGTKFNLPKFGIGLPEIKGPKIDVTSGKAEIDISVPKGKVEVHPPDVEVQSVTAEVKAELPEVDSKDFEVKMKTPGFSFPKIGFDKSDGKAPEVDVSLPKGNLEIEKPTTDVTVSIEDAELKGRSKFGSPTKFKLPSLNFPKFGVKSPKASVEIPDVDVEVKGPEISLPDAEIKLSAEPLSVDVKGPDAEKQAKSVNMEIKDQDIQMKKEGTKFNLPKFGISLPEIKGPKIDATSGKAEIDISVPKGKVEVHPPDVEVQSVTAEVKADLPEVDSKDFEVKMKTPGFSFPKIGFDKSDVKAPEVDVSLPKGNLEIEKPTTDVTVSIEDAELKGRSKFGSPTKFKLPSLNFPKFGVKSPKASVEIPDVDVEVKGPEISVPDAEIKLSAEPFSVDVKGPDTDKQTKSVSMEIKDQDIQMKKEGTKFNLPKFGIGLPEIKGPKIDVTSGKAEIDISVPKGKVEVHPPDVEVQSVTAEVKAELPEVDSKDFEVKMKTPGFSFPKIGFDKSDGKAPEVDVSLPKGNLEIEMPTTDVTVSIEDAELKGRSKFGSPTKFKLPSLNFPKFGVKSPKASVEIPDVDVEVKGPEISLPDAEIKLSAEPLSVDVKGPDAEKQAKSVNMEIKDQDIQMKKEGTKFNLPKFGISLPEIKGPKIDATSGKAEIDISVPKGKVKVHPPDVEVQGVTAEVKADLPEVDSKDFEVKMKTPGFSFPKIGFDKSDVKAPEVDVSLPEGKLEIEKPTTDVTVSIEDAELKGRSKFGSPTKFKLPSLNFPKFGAKGPKASVEIPDVDVEVKGPEISLPDAEIKLSAEPLSVDVKGPDAEKQAKSVNMEIKDQDIQMKKEGTKFNLPKFGISLPEIKGPKIDATSGKAEIDISVPKGKVKVHPPDVEVQGVTAEVKADLPEVDSKDFEVKMKTPGFSFPKIGFDKSDVKAPEVDVSLPEGKLEIEKPTTDVTVSIEDAELKGRSKFGSPTKFRLPSLNFPKFGAKGPKASVEIPDVDVEVKGPEISLPDAEIKLSAEPLSVDVKGPDAEKQAKSVNMEIKDQDIQMKKEGTKFNLPKFGISLPEIKGPKIDVTSGKAEIDISVPKGKVKVHPPDVEVQGVTAEVKADLPEVDSKDFEVKMKTPGFSFPKIGFDKSDVKAPEVDVSLPEGKLEIEKPTTDVTVSIEDAELKGRSKFGSPTKFKLPSLNFPKFGAKGPKASVEIPDVDVKVKGPEISLPDAEIKLSAEPLSVDVKGPDTDKQAKSVSMEIKDEDIQMKKEGTKFNLPKFGISLPEIKGPKKDVTSGKAEIDISVPKGKVKVHPPDVEVQGVTAEVKADLPEVDSKDFEVKMKTPGFSFPKIGFDKSDVKAPEVDVSLPEGKLEIEKPTTDVTVSIEDAELKGRSKFGSPTKFKLPSLNFPKFGAKGPKASVEIPDVDVEVKGPEINLPDAEIKLSAEPLSVDVKGPDAEKQAKSVSMEIKDQDIQMKKEGTKFNLPKFGISLPEIKGPKIDVTSGKAEIDISVPHPPDVEVQGVTAEVKADLPEVDSKDFEVKMKTPGFSFPKIGFDKSDVKAPEVDVSLPEGKLEIEKPTTDVTVSIEDAELKGRSKFGSPTKFKLPSLNFPKFGAKGPKASIEIPDVDVEVKGPEINLPDAEIKLSAEPLSVDVKGPDTEKQAKSVSMEIKDQDIKMKKEGTKFNLPKFGISLPEIKGPKIDVTSGKAEIDISVPHPPDVEVQGVTAEVKADLPEVDSKDFEIKMKTPGFSFPKIGFNKSEVKAPEVDVSLPEGKLEIEKPTTDVTVSIEDAELKGRSKFGSPTKFKLPSLNFPKFGAKGPKASVEIPDVDVEVKGPEISLPDAEIKLSAEPLSVDVKGPDAEKQAKSVSMEIKDQDIQMKKEGTKFNLPKFGISLPEIKGPKIDVTSGKAEIDISVPKGKVEVHPPDVEVQGVTAEVKADLPEVDSKNFEVKMKVPGFSFPKIGFDKSDVTAPEVDVSLPEGNLGIEKPTTDVTVSIEDAELKGRSKFGSPTKFKLPSLNFPKFGAKGSKASVEIPDVNVEVKGPEISLPDAEIKLSAEPLSVDVKGPDAKKQAKSVSMEIKDQDVQMKKEGTKFNLPKFGISLPDIKGPKIDVSSGKPKIDISVPKGKVEVHPPDVKVQGVTAEVKADLPEVDSKDFEVKMKTPGFSFPKIGFDKSEVKAPEVDVSLPEGNLEIEKPTTDVTVSIEDAELKGRSKFGSPTKFKLPSLNFPKFGAKGPKASVEIPDVDVEVKGSEISLPDAEIKLSIVDPPDVEVQGVTTEVKADLPEVDSKDVEVKMKRPGLSFSKFSKSDSKVPASDPSLQIPDISAPEKFKTEQNLLTKSSSPTKLKLPLINIPKFVKGLEVSLPDADFSAESVSEDIKEHAVTKDDDFGMAPPKVKDPEINIVSKSSSKPESGISLTKEVKIQSLNVKVKNVEINNEDPIPQMDSLMGTYIVKNDKASVDILESKQKYTQRVQTSSKFIFPTLGDVFSGFEVEFNVPTFDENEGAKKIYSDIPLTKEECNITVKGQFSAESVSKHEDGGAQEKSKTEQNNFGGQKQTQPEISDWFRFPAFSSPTKTVKDNERITFQLLRKAEPSPENDINVNECKKSFTREFDEDNISPTLSLSSSDAFADISSALTTEQISLSLPSPTKVKVKYSEPIANAEGSDIHIVTSTARTELISIEPHQPEKVNIPFSSETSSSSVDTLKQISGHIVVANVQSVSKTEHATIITKVDTQDLKTLPGENVTDTMLSAKETAIQTEHRTIYQKHSIKEVH